MVPALRSMVELVLVFTILINANQVIVARIDSMGCRKRTSATIRFMGDYLLDVKGHRTSFPDPTGRRHCRCRSLVVVQ